MSYRPPPSDTAVRVPFPEIFPKELAKVHPKTVSANANPGASTTTAKAIINAFFATFITTLPSSSRIGQSHCFWRCMQFFFHQ
jgi:hypothetical protein